MSKTYKCFLTGEILKEGDIIIRPVFGSFEKHILVRFTKQGFVISRKAHQSLHGFCWATTEDDVYLHDIIQYISYPPHLIKIGKYEGDLKKFNLTISQFRKKHNLK